MKQRSHSFLAVLLIVAMLAMAVTPAMAAPLNQEATGAGDLQFTAGTVAPAQGIVVEPKGATGSAVYMVQLKDAGLATYRGGVDGLAPTSLALASGRKLNASSNASKAYLAYLAEQRAAALSAAETTLGRSLAVKYEYQASFNGFAAEMTPAEAAKVAALDGVVRVEREQMFQPTTDAGPEWIGAPGIWDGTMTGGLPGTKGEGVVVGVIDTGIDPWNPSFAATGGDGYTVENPLGDGVYVGVCDPANTNPPAGTVAYDPTFPCNSKLIGAWGYTTSDPNPRDGDGHGSHTASTAAGNVVHDSIVETPSRVFTATMISGVAPHANIIMYDGCIDGGGCPGASLSAARDQAILDGVDVINYSIGASSPTADPYNDIEAQQWLAIREAGIFAATSAGNNGPGDATVGSPADLPWITSVGASSHNRAFLNSLTLNDGTNAPITIDGEAMTGGYGPAAVVLAADYVIPPATATDARLCAPGAFPPGTFDGEIVVCERGVHGRVAKGQSVADGGAGGFILAQPTEFGGGPGAVGADPHVIPAVHITYGEYQRLLDYLDAAPGAVMGTISGATLDYNDAHGDIMAAFSSRGPNGGTFSSLIVPSLNTPGLNIWAAYHQGPAGDGDYTWNVISGTSMASPHTAGAGALMVALHPDWSPAQIQSALMSTAVDTVLNDDGVNTATPFAQGSGRVDLGEAAQAGLVLDVSIQDYENSDPNAGGDPRALNTASLGNASCVSECSWTRTFESTMDAGETWTATLELPDGVTGSVEPASFTIAAGGSQAVEVTVNVSGATADEWHFGRLVLTPASADVPMAHLPIAVKPATGDIPELVTIITNRNAGSQVVSGLTSVPTDDLTAAEFGLSKATLHAISLAVDPTNSAAYDNLSQVWWTTFTVPEGTKRIVAEAISSTAPDIDLYWGSGSTPSAATQLGVSAGGSWNEYLNAHNPPAGTYWVLVQNWAGSASQPDAIELALAVVGGDMGNMWVEAPSSVGALEPFDISVYYDLDAMAGDFWYGGFTLGTSAATPDNIGLVDVNLHRVQDDVAKTVNANSAIAGQTLTYQITIQPNITNVDLNYTLTDMIPAGLTYVPGSASASSGSVAVNGNTLTWNGVVAVPEVTYAYSTSDNDPACKMPLANSGAYTNLAGYGLATNPNVSGDTVSYTWNPSGGAFNFFGSPQGEVINFTDDGFTFFDPATTGATPWTNTMIPDAAQPNNLMALFWRDMEIVYDQAANRGVTAANLTSGGVPSAALLEYDDVMDWGSDPETTYDFEMLARYEASDNWYEYIFAYDNINGDPAASTVGVENVDGSVGVQVAYNDFQVHNGMAICFDLTSAGNEPIVITYKATVNAGVPAGTQLTNHVESITDNPGSMTEVASASVTVLNGVNRSRRFNVDRDTFISGVQPATYFGSAQTMWTGFFGQLRPVVHTPLEAVPSDAVVDLAYLYLYIVEGRGFINWTNSVINVEAHPVTAEWMPDAVNWTSPWTMAGGDYGPAVGGNHIGSAKINTWLRLDVTDAVRDIVGGADNNGFIITNTDAIGVRYGLATKEYFDASKGGYIRVYFRTAQ